MIMDKVIIFGATGSVGCYTALHLKEIGYEVIAVGLRENDNGFFGEFDIPYYSVDISVPESFDILPQKNITHVCHFAGVMPSKMKGYDPQLYIDTIISGTFNVLEFIRKVNAEKIIFTQTRADSSHLMGSKKPISSDIQRTFPVNSDHSIYTICKNAALDIIEHYHAKYGLKRFILRLPTIYAYHPNAYFFVDGKIKMKAYRQIIQQAMNSEPVEIWGDPTLEKEIVYVKDLVQIIEKSIASDKDGGIYNVGRGVGVTLEEQIKGIVDVFSPKDKPSNIIYRPDKPNGRQFVHDISKTTNELGYLPYFDYHMLLDDFKLEMERKRFFKLWGNA